MGSPAASIFAAGPERDRRIALTFDDGPAASTEAALDVLSAEDAPAALPAIVRGLRRDGYELVTVSDLIR